MKNTEYRNCFKNDTESNCVFAAVNQSGTHCCTIDRVVQTRWYGCVPQNIIYKASRILEKEFEEENELSKNKWKCHNNNHTDKKTTIGWCAKNCVQKMLFTESSDARDNRAIVGVFD